MLNDYKSNRQWVLMITIGSHHLAPKFFSGLLQQQAATTGFILAKSSLRCTVT